MSRTETGLPGLATRSVTDRFVDLSDKLNAYLQRFRQFGIRSNRAVANYLRVDSAELSRLKNARVGDINLQRGYEILRKCEELARRLSKFGGPLKCRDVYSVGYNVSELACVSRTEQAHAISLQQQSDAVLLTIDVDAQREELDMLLADVLRSAIHPRRNPFGPMSCMYVLKSVYASPSATPQQMLKALRITHTGRRACEPSRFASAFDPDLRLRTLAVILNNGGGIALRLAKEVPARRTRMLHLSRHLHTESLSTFYFAGTVRGALTCANDMQDADWAKDLLRLIVEKEGRQKECWPKGIRADLDDPQEWQFLKDNSFWNLLDFDASECGIRQPAAVGSRR